jgi:FixJ family two-component response regulator
MPRMSGPELAERIVTVRPDIRLLFMSGYTEQPFPRHTLGNNPVELLQKPFTPQTLAESVRNALSLQSRSGARHSD